MNKIPEGYPLEPIDAVGKQVNEGDIITIDPIPESCLPAYLSKEEKNDVLSCEGKDMEVVEIDEYGFIWVEKVLLQTKENYNTHSFSIEPKYVNKIK